MKTMTATAAIAIAATVAAADPIGPFSDNIYNDGTFTETSFVGEARWGNAASNGDWELDVHNFNQSANGTQQQIAWTSGTEYFFTLSWLSTGSATLEVFEDADRTSSLGTDTFNNASSNFSHLAVRLRGSAAGTSTMTIDATSWDVGNFATSYVFGADSSSDFVLDGRFVFASGNGSAPAFQIKAGNFVPTPAAAGMGLAGIGLVAARRRRA